MNRAHDVIGLPVIELKTGKEVGHVRDLLFNEQWYCTGVLLGEKSLLRQGSYLSVEAVHAVGTDCVTIADAGAVIFFEEPPGWIGLETGNSHLKGKPFITECGRHLGFVEDVYFQPQLGKILGYELSDGILSDIMDGRRVIRHTKNIKMGEDVIIVSGTE
ncbi:PRC-barrel domain-containing protein [Aneurinibacillus tyrosinisolvens]|uniref:PRC-barrel domain-containing protein n=1 Tax=Aneurinibacillus tyrosinisolvens TaxID=1443435 RepID=UPI00063F13F3|nr:PRC-barrel domain-containing protein [Aneurinibacillus tyrosinisolvens]